MIVQLSILCVIAIPGHPFIKMPLLFKNVLNMCISSASHGSNKAKKHSSAICYLPSMQNWGLRSYYKSYFFHWVSTQSLYISLRNVYYSRVDHAMQSRWWPYLGFCWVPPPRFPSSEEEKQPNAQLDIFLDVDILWLKVIYIRHKKMNQNGPNLAYYIHVHSSAEMSQTACSIDPIIHEIHMQQT